MPVFCPGFQALSDRLKTQGRAVGEFSTRLHQVNASLDALLARHELQTDVRAAAAQRRHAALGARVLALAGRVQVLRNRGYALGSDEDELQERLNALSREVHDPAVGAREEELWSRLIGLKAWGEQLAKELEGPSRGDGGEIDDEVESKAKKVRGNYILCASFVGLGWTLRRALLIADCCDRFSRSTSCRFSI